MIIPLGAENGRYTLNEFIIGSLLVNSITVFPPVENIARPQKQILFVRFKPDMIHYPPPVLGHFIRLLCVRNLPEAL